MITIGGLLYEFFPNAPYLLTGIAYVIAAVFFLSIDDQFEAQRDREGKVFNIILQGISHVLKGRLLLAVILFAGGVSAATCEWAAD